MIEGRKPNYYISVELDEITGEKADYICHRGFKDEHYKKMVLDYLDKYEYASKEDIDKLILDILPDVLDKQQKENKVKNLIYAMHKKDKTLVNRETNRKPIWKKFV
nr:hypothetical protein [uncultured Flavobacterium sp.]